MYAIRSYYGDEQADDVSGDEAGFDDGDTGDAGQTHGHHADVVGNDPGTGQGTAGQGAQERLHEAKVDTEDGRLSDAQQAGDA